MSNKTQRKRQFRMCLRKSTVCGIWWHLVVRTSCVLHQGSCWNLQVKLLNSPLALASQVKNRQQEDQVMRKERCSSSFNCFCDTDSDDYTSVVFAETGGINSRMLMRHRCHSNLTRSNCNDRCWVWRSTQGGGRLINAVSGWWSRRMSQQPVKGDVGIQN